jgi:hypothetical protein
MSLQTHNIAKGVPPRGHLPKRTKSNSGNKKDRTRKRASTEDSSDDEPEDSEPTTRKKARTSERNRDSEDEIEMIDLDPTPPPEDIGDDEEARLANGNEVSI